MIYLATFKLTISDTKGRSISRELKDADANQLIGKSIDGEIDAAPLGLVGKLVITGGSDKSGVPMRKDVHGAARKYIMISRGVGLPHAPTGQRVSKLIRGCDITEEIFQVNCRYDGVLEVPSSEASANKDAPDESKKTADTQPDSKTKGDSKKTADTQPDSKTKDDSKKQPPDSEKKQA